MLWFGHMLKLKSVESGPFKKQTNKKHMYYLQEQEVFCH